MSRKHALPVVLLLGAAAVAGLVALGQTLDLGASAQATPLPARMIAARSRALDRVEASLKRSLAQRPPKLPAIPAAATPDSAKVVYVRAKPIVVHTARRSDDGYESDAEHSGTGESGDD